VHFPAALTQAPGGDTVAQMRYTPIAFLCLLLALGCEVQEPPTPSAAAAEPAKPGPAAPVVPGGKVMATVNGRPIYMKDLYQPLVEADGLRMAEMLIADAIVAQEAARRSVSATDSDVEAENQHSLKNISHLLNEALGPDQRERLLDQLLASRGLTRSLWQATMRRNALLRKMVAPQVVVSEAMLKVEYDRRYGEKVQISHVQLPTFAEAEKIIALLKAGEDFAALARKHSTNTDTARVDGMISPAFTQANASVPKPIRDAAFALRRPGEISGVVQVGSEFHVLKLRQRIPAPPADFGKVKEQLRGELRERLTERLQLQLLRDLRTKADVDYINPALRTAVKRQSRP